MGHQCDGCRIINDSVSMCQGDMPLCPECNTKRFGVGVQETRDSTSASKIGAIETIVLTPINAIRQRLFKSPSLDDSPALGGSTDSLHLLNAPRVLQRIAEEDDDSVEGYMVCSGRPDLNDVKKQNKYKVCVPQCEECEICVQFS